MLEDFQRHQYSWGNELKMAQIHASLIDAVLVGSAWLGPLQARAYVASDVWFTKIMVL